MEGDSSSGWQGKGALEELMRERIRTTIEGIIDEELVAALGAARSQRSGPVRVGYRHGKRSRTLTTSLGPTTIALPRARLEGEDGRRREWRSAIIPRYQRRTEPVDEAIRRGVPQWHQHASDCAEHWPRCYAVLRCQRMQYRVWSGACARISPRGHGGISVS